MASSDPFEQLCTQQRESALLGSVVSLLGWDERTLMPAAGGAYRAEQMKLMSGMVHRMRTDSRIGDWLQQLEDDSADAHSDRGATIREVRRQYEKQQKLPARLVEELTEASVLGQQAWVEARKNNDYASFIPTIRRILDLRKEQAEAVGYDDSPYDALLDDYEPGATCAGVKQVLEQLREELVPLVNAIAQASRRPDLEILRREYPREAQETFGTEVATAIGFDFQAGRLDVTHHPFCCETGPHDCRITTRYDERFFPSGFFSILHEAGHGTYEQGLRSEQYGLPPGSYRSLGIHESQSRLWENAVGRSLPFWNHFFARAQHFFPAALNDVKVEQFHFAVNDVRSSLIRVEADEVTYNLHIIIRFELEQELVRGELQPEDLPSAWNSRYETYLGITPPDDADGVLQDVHWSAGLFGYFPTYSLGNLYAAQLMEAADRDLGSTSEMFQRGEFRPLLEWMQQNIHQKGQCYSAEELVTQVTGQPLSHQPLVAYLRSKFQSLYGL